MSDAEAAWPGKSVVAVSGLVKWFGGARAGSQAASPGVRAVSMASSPGVRALDHVSLAVDRGTIFGLLGQNGAGKTTLVKILLGLLAPSEGTAELLGRPVGSPVARREVGYLPEDHQLPPYHTAESLLDFYGSLQGLCPRDRRRRSAEVLERVGLAGRSRERIRGYSKGMRQRLALAQALLHEPSVLFLDEPTDGVDPLGRRQIRELLLAERDRGVTVFINSHLLGEVEDLCDRVAILRKGVIVRQGTVGQVVESRATWLVAFDRPVPEALTWRSGRLMPSGRPGLLRFDPAAQEDPEAAGSDASAAVDRLLAEAIPHGLRLRHLERERRTLEDVYLELAVPARGEPTA
jgi:ABC-2 type transport system ATP-binding protein